LLTLFPNPVQAGEALAIYIVDIEDNSTKLEVYDITGKVLMSRATPKGNSNYIITLTVAPGSYFVTLVKGNDRLETEKIIVK